MLDIPWLDPQNLSFPALDQALEEPDGLLAVGGDLSSARLINAYRQGIFPWYDRSQPILWWSPDPRMVLYPQDLHVSKSLRKEIHKKSYQITMNKAFAKVIHSCAKPRLTQQELQLTADMASDPSWITRDMESAYCRLHKQGYAHSVEVWRGDDLIGGLYGLAMGKVFFGESMFSLQANTSKIALVHLVEQLVLREFTLIDCQVSSDHLFSLGAKEISRAKFTEHLRSAIGSNTLPTDDFNKTF